METPSQLNFQLSTLRVPRKRDQWVLHQVTVLGYLQVKLSVCGYSGTCDECLVELETRRLKVESSMEGRFELKLFLVESNFQVLHYCYFDK